MAARWVHLGPYMNENNTRNTTQKIMEFEYILWESTSGERLIEAVKVFQAVKHNQKLVWK